MRNETIDCARGLSWLVLLTLSLVIMACRPSQPESIFDQFADSTSVQPVEVEVPVELVRLLNSGLVTYSEWLDPVEESWLAQMNGVHADLLRLGEDRTGLLFAAGNRTGPASVASNGSSQVASLTVTAA